MMHVEALGPMPVLLIGNGSTVELAQHGRLIRSKPVAVLAVHFPG